MPDKKRGMRRNLTAYGDEAFSLFLRKAFIKAMGYWDVALDRPIIGITNTYSGFNACPRAVPELIEAVKRGGMLAGGMPVDFPTISLHESFAYPTSMYLRNLMSIDTEEMIRGLPVDALVLIGGCDKMSRLPSRGPGCRMTIRSRRRNSKPSSTAPSSPRASRTSSTPERIRASSSPGTTTSTATPASAS